MLFAVTLRSDEAAFRPLKATANGIDESSVDDVYRLDRGSRLDQLRI
jgi:hypothetical protein